MDISLYSGMRLRRYGSNEANEGSCCCCKNSTVIVYAGEVCFEAWDQTRSSALDTAGKIASGCVHHS
jgi:hypothetical protein